MGSGNSLKKKLMSKRGASILLEMLLVTFLLTFMVFMPVAYFAYIQRSNVFQDIGNTTVQMMSLQGGVTTEVLERTRENLEYAGFDPDEVLYWSGSDFAGVLSKPIRYKGDLDGEGKPQLLRVLMIYPADREASLLSNISKLVGPGSDKEADSTGRTFYKYVGGSLVPVTVNQGFEGGWYYKAGGYTTSERKRP